MELTKEQELAVVHVKGPALVIAGPGSGKTRILTERVRCLVEDNRVKPENIMVTTFTEKAANELKVRLSKNLGKVASRIYISTIHSFCSTLLREHFTEHNLGVGFEVLDDESRKLLLRTNKFKLGIFLRKGNSFKWLKNASIDEFIILYDFLSRNDIEVDKLKKELIKQKELNEDDEKVLNSYKKYLSLLEEENKIDFENLQLKFYKLINNNPDILKEVRNKFEYLLVDEYQDTSPLEDRIFRLLAPPQNNIFVVGDRNQSIYGFRGASFLNFENFTKHFPKAKIYYLNENFRSTVEIVGVSNSLMKDKIKEELKARRRKGEKTVLLKGETEDSTAEKTVSLIKKMKEKRIIEKYGDVALLFRCWHHSKEYVKCLEDAKIPYIVFGGGGLLDREEIRTMVYLISYITQKVYMGKRFRKWNWWDIESFKGEVLKLSSQTISALEHLDPDVNIADLKTEEELNKVGILQKVDVKKILDLNALRKEIGESNEKISVLKIFYKILEISGYLSRLLNDKTRNSEEKLYNIARLSEIIGIHERMPESRIDDFLWFVYSSADEFDEKKIEDENTVKIMTVHKAKGLEFPVVFLCSLVEGRFPLKFRKAKYIIPVPKKFYLVEEEYELEKEAFYEEERRLFYVGITRAQDNLILTTSDKIRVQDAEKSRFLEEIDDYVVKEKEVELPIEKTYKVVREIPELNYSAVNTYVDCPFRYKLIYKYGFDTPGGYPQILGIFLHNVLQRIHRKIEEGEKLKESDIKKFVDEYWIPISKKKKEDKEMKSNYIETIKNYYKNAIDFYDEILAIEEPFVHIDDNIVINGRVDLIVKDKNGDINLIDFKARTSEGIQYTNTDKQLRMYNHCLQDDFNIDKLVAYTCLDNKRTEFEPRTEDILSFLESMSGEIKKENFVKRESPFCQYCTFKFCC
jgi:DNA helicase-2/ATP-dependent DNA helicase PcrA